MRSTTLRRGKQPPPPSSASHNRQAPPPTPTTTFNPWKNPPPPKTRDSAASISHDKSTHLSSLATINHYISSTFNHPPIHSPLATRDIQIFEPLLSHLGFPISKNLSDDVTIVLKTLNCPIKFNKSALRAPGERRASSMLIAIIYWLVQLCRYNDGFARNQFMSDNRMLLYVKDCYRFYMDGDDGSVLALDDELFEKLEDQNGLMMEDNRSLQGEIREIEEKLVVLKGEGSGIGRLEREKEELEEDERKFREIIEQFEKSKEAREKAVRGKEEELRVKEEEFRRVCEENEEIRRRVEEQGISARDAERMKREICAVEREVSDLEVARSGWEERIWNLNVDIGRKFKELEERVIECNQAIRRLKLGSEFQYQLNAEGSTPAEVLGIDYKTTLKPTLAAFFEEIKRASVEKWEELISLQKQATESASRIDSKRSRISTLATQIEEVEALLDLIRNETQDYTSRCSAEARKIAKELEAETSNMVIAERDAAEHLKVSEGKLQAVIIQTEEKVQLCARNLFAVVDSVSKFKEYVAQKISEMKNDLSETAVKVADAHKYTLPVMFQTIDDKSMLME